MAHTSRLNPSLELLFEALFSSKHLRKHSLFLVGFPIIRNLHRVRSSLSSVKPEDWVSRVRHVVPEASAFEFTPFRNDVEIHAEDNNNVVSPIQSLNLGNTSTASGEEAGTADGSELTRGDFGAAHNGERFCSAQGLQEEAYLLLDGAKEPNPGSANVSRTPKAKRIAQNNHG